MAGGEVPTMQECMDDHAEGLTSREQMIAQLEEMIAGKGEEIINETGHADRGFAQMGNDYYQELRFDSSEDLANALLSSSVNIFELSREGIIEEIYRQQGIELPESEQDYIEGSTPHKMSYDLERFVFGLRRKILSYQALNQSLKTIQRNENNVHEDLSKCLLGVQNGVSE